MRDESTPLGRLKTAWSKILALSGSQPVGGDSIKLVDTQTGNEWDVNGDVLLAANDDSQWTVTFTPENSSKPVYSEFTFKYEITSGDTPYSFDTYSWDDPSTTTGNTKKFVVWRMNNSNADQTIRMKFGIRASQPGTISWVRNR